MKKFLWIVFAISIIIGLSGCNENARTKSFGGTMVVEIPQGQKFVNATWKDQQLWYLTRPMTSNEVAETWTLQEKSSLGMMEGTVIFRETK